MVSSRHNLLRSFIRAAAAGQKYGQSDQKRNFDDVVKIKISLRRHSGGACAGLDPVAGIQ
jgi:hypothetical protein